MPQFGLPTNFYMGQLKLLLIQHLDLNVSRLDEKELIRDG